MQGRHKVWQTEICPKLIRYCADKEKKIEENGNSNLRSVACQENTRQDKQIVNINFVHILPMTNKNRLQKWKNYTGHVQRTTGSHTCRCCWPVRKFLTNWSMSKVEKPMEELISTSKELFYFREVGLTFSYL